MFAHQKEINGETLSATVLDFGKKASLDVAKLKQYMMELTTLPTIRADLAEAERLGFNGAPVFVINHWGSG